MKTESAEEMRARISQQIREDFKREINKNWIYGANKNVRNGNFYNWIYYQFLRV